MYVSLITLKVLKLGTELLAATSFQLSQLQESTHITSAWYSLCMHIIYEEI